MAGALSPPRKEGGGAEQLFGGASGGITLWRGRLSFVPVVVVLCTAFFLRLTEPFPPVLTCACSRASLSLFMPAPSTRASDGSAL